MIRMAMLLSIALCLPVTLAGADSMVEGEIGRLEGCPAVYETSSPPVHIKVRWSSPRQAVATDYKSKLVMIEFLVAYDQSDFFPSKQEADRAMEFHPMLELRQRNFYARDAGRLRLRYRESLIGKKWERQKTDTAKFACWQHDAV